MSLPPSPILRVALVDESAARAAVLEEGLREAGPVEIRRVPPSATILRALAEFDPDVIIIDLASPSRDALEQMFEVSRLVRRPVAMFVDRTDTETTTRAIEAGVSAYVVNGLRKDRVRPILDACITRFRAFAKLQDELEKARGELENRKLIDRAKGIIMAMKGLDEPAAFALLRRTAMSENRRIAEVAQSIVTAAAVLGTGRLS